MRCGVGRPRVHGGRTCPFHRDGLYGHIDLAPQSATELRKAAVADPGVGTAQKPDHVRLRCTRTPGELLVAQSLPSPFALELLRDLNGEARDEVALGGPVLPFALLLEATLDIRSFAHQFLRPRGDRRAAGRLPGPRNRHDRVRSQIWYPGRGDDNAL